MRKILALCIAFCLIVSFSYAAIDKEVSSGGGLPSGGAATDYLAGDETWKATSTISSAYARSSTKVVAAYNSKDTTNADFFCDGTNDEEQIQQALDIATGGTVLLLDGDFYIQGKKRVLYNIKIENAGTVLTGTGWGTRLIATNGQVANVSVIGLASDNTVVANMYIKGSREVPGATSTSLVRAFNTADACKNVTIQNVYAEDSDDDGLTTELVAGVRILDCYVVDADDYSINCEGSGIVRNNVIDLSDGSVGSRFDGTSEGGFLVMGNSFINQEGALDVINLDDTTRFIGNSIHNIPANREGIVVGGEDIVITGNYISGQVKTNNTGIRLASTGDECYIGGNLLVNLLYGIDADAGAENGVIAYNNMFDVTNPVVNGAAFGEITWLLAGPGTTPSVVQGMWIDNGSVFVGDGGTWRKL